MGLKQRLQAMMAIRPAGYRAMLDDLAGRLRRSALPGVLKPGDTMPAFVLPTTAGDLVSSDDLLARGPLVVCFFRGGWCPFCRTTMSALADLLPAIEAAGANLVAIAPDGGELAFGNARDLGLRYPVLCDIDGATAMEFGVLHRLPDGLRDDLLRGGIDVSRWHGDDAGLLPMPATFVAGRDGVLRFAHASGDITDRPEPEDVVRLLRQMATDAA